MNFFIFDYEKYAIQGRITKYYFAFLILNTYHMNYISILKTMTSGFPIDIVDVAQ
jgi:hypothetical protein